MSEKRTYSTHSFPDLVVSEILTRIPGKTVCRFKCVSKRWKSIICNHRFVLSYISRASSPSWVIINRIPRLANESTQYPTQLTLGNPPKVSTFSIIPHKLAAEHVTDDPPRKRHPKVILDSSNGLLLLSLLIKRDPHKEYAKNPDHFVGRFDEPALCVVNPIPHWPTPLPPRFYAAFAKEEGNEHFKKQEFIEAVKYYSKSIHLSPSAAAYANRAMSYLKVQSYSEAENDCSKALKLDDKYFKVYARRAKARIELGNLKGSMDDVEFALKLEPGNREMRTLYAKVSSLLEKAPVVERLDGHDS